jgi:hypothetical protein
MKYNTMIGNDGSDPEWLPVSKVVDEQYTAADIKLEIGQTLKWWGEIEEGNERLLESIVAIRASSEIYNAFGNFVYQASALNSLANATFSLGSKTKSIAKLQEARRIYDDALSMSKFGISFKGMRETIEKNIRALERELQGLEEELK